MTTASLFFRKTVLRRLMWAGVALLLQFSVFNSASAQDSVEVVHVADGVDVEMVWVEGGSFRMGSNSAVDKDGRYGYEAYRPEHSVTVGGFYMARLEVTQRLWEAVMGENPSYFTGNDSLPVERVSWVDAQRFVALLSQMTGRRFRLPTEAEWEYAARGGVRGSGKTYAGSGRGRLDDYAWYCVDSENRTHPVGRLLPNELGLCDMSGNVAEWCSDWWAPYDGTEQHNPQGPADGESRIVRGGNWGSVSAGVAVFDRGWYVPTGKTEYYGLRLAMDPPEEDEYED